MAILVDSGRVAIAQALASGPLYLAWGSGLAAWDTALEPEPIDATALVTEFGRRLAATQGYCTPDAAGEIVTQEGGRYRESAAPTKWLFLRFSFDFADGGNEVVRELGVFAHVTVDPALPPGQRYFTPDQIVDPGKLLLLERLARPTYLSNSQRNIYETVFTL